MNALIDAIKEVGEGSKHLEKVIREMVGIRLNHGFSAGKSYAPLERLLKESGLAISCFTAILEGWLTKQASCRSFSE